MENIEPVDHLESTRNDSTVPACVDQIRNAEGRPEFPRRGLRPIKDVVEELAIKYRLKLASEIERLTGE